MEKMNPYQSPESALNVSAEQQYYEPNIFALNGRIGRVQYVLYGFATGIALMFLLALVLGVGYAISGGKPSFVFIILSAAIYIAMFAYTFILAKRRLNDVNRSGWLSLLMIIPVINIFLLLYLWFARGDEGANDYGLPSKKSTSAFVLVLALLGGTALIGILAAIALPAYQEYTDRMTQSQAQ